MDRRFHELFSPEEYALFLQAVHSTAEKFPDIIGVLAVGSLRAILPTILAKKADPTIRFSDEEYKYYAQNLVHSPDNEVELQGLFQLVGFSPK